MQNDLLTKNPDLPKLLRIIATGENAKQHKHDIIFNQAADELDGLRERLRIAEELNRDFTALQHTLVGNTGLSAIQEAVRLRKLHPLGKPGRG